MHLRRAAENSAAMSGSWTFITVACERIFPVAAFHGLASSFFHETPIGKRIFSTVSAGSSLAHVSLIPNFHASGRIQN
jgi:hypothetical protein